MGVNLGLGAFLLLPVAVLVQLVQPTIGDPRLRDRVRRRPGSPAWRSSSSSVACADPGRVLVVERPAVDQPAVEAGPEPPAGVAPGHAAAAPGQLDRFLRSITLAAFGAGFGPYLSIYAISVLGLPPSFAILLAALASAASLVSATIVGGLLGRGSASRTLRLSFLMRGGSMILGLLAFPQNPLAGLVLCAVAILASAGAAAGTLSSNERLMRLAPGPGLIRRAGPVRGRDRDGVTAGQLVNAAILAVLPLGYPTFAILFTVSGLTRFFTAARADVSATWSSGTVAYRIEDHKEHDR